MKAHFSLEKVRAKMAARSETHQSVRPYTVRALRHTLHVRPHISFLGTSAWSDCVHECTHACTLTRTHTGCRCECFAQRCFYCPSSWMADAGIRLATATGTNPRITNQKRTCQNALSSIKTCTHRWHVCTHVEGTLFVWFLDLCWVPGMLCIHIYTHTHTHVCKRTYMHCKHINMHIYTRYLHMRIRVRVCDHIRKRVCKYKYPTRNSEFWNPPHIYAGTCAAIPLSLYIHINLVPCSPSLRYTSAYKKIWPSPP